MTHEATLSNADRYAEYVRGADANDRLRFDAYVIAYLSAVVDEELFTKALEYAAVCSPMRRSNMPRST